MRTIMMATMLLLPVAAHATQPNVPPPFQSGGATAAASAAASASATAAQQQTQRQSTIVRSTNVAGGGAGGSATSGPVSVDVSSNDRTYAMALGGYAAASGPCIGVSTSAGVGILGWMFQGGRTEIESECQVREAARIAASIGMIGLAQDLIRSLPSVRKATASLEPPATITAPAPAPAPAPEPAVWRNGVMPSR